MNECIRDFKEVWELLEKRRNRETKSYHELFLGEVGEKSHVQTVGPNEVDLRHPSLVILGRITQ